MNKLWLLPVAGVVLGVLKKSDSMPASLQPLQLSGVWTDSDGPRRIHAIARPIELAMNWPGLGTYLAAISWIESRGNPKAGTTAADNRARGWFGMRPASARIEELGLPRSALQSERESVALAAWYAYRCIKYGYPGQQLTWLAVRRCWNRPQDTDNVGSDISIANLTEGLDRTGVSRDFMHALAFPPGFQWLGIETALQLARSA